MSLAERERAGVTGVIVCGFEEGVCISVFDRTMNL